MKNIMITVLLLAVLATSTGAQDCAHAYETCAVGKTEFRADCMAMMNNSAICDAAADQYFRCCMVGKGVLSLQRV